MKVEIHGLAKWRQTQKDSSLSVIQWNMSTYSLFIDQYFYSKWGIKKLCTRAGLEKNQKNPSLDVTLWNTVGFWALCVYLSDYCLYNKTSKNRRLIYTAEVAFLRCFTSWCTGNLNINIHHVLISLFLCQAQKHLELTLFCFSAVMCGFVWFHFSLYSPTKTSSYARLLSSFKLWSVEEINSWCVAGK